MTRDMTKPEFRAALKRNGFRVVLFWLDRPGVEGPSIGIIIDQKGRVYRRATIAHAIREFAKHDAAVARARRAPSTPMLDMMQSQP